MSNEITQEFLKSILHYNPENGVFTWRHCESVRMVVRGKIAGYFGCRNYWFIKIQGREIRAHRLAWLYVYGEMPKEYIDHINGIKTDNRILNLRDVDQTINVQNLKKAQKNSKSGFLGVRRQTKSNKWIAEIGVNSKRKYIGQFETPELAHEAYLAAKRILHEGCTI